MADSTDRRVAFLLGGQMGDRCNLAVHCVDTVLAQGDQRRKKPILRQTKEIVCC